MGATASIAKKIKALSSEDQVKVLQHAHIVEEFHFLLNGMPRPSSQVSVQSSDAIPHGCLSDFYGGLGKRVGVVSLDFYEQMRKEHCEFVGCLSQFTSSNYSVTTCPRQEWLLVTEGLLADACQNVPVSETKSVRRRTPARWWNHLEPASADEFLFSNVRDPKKRCSKVIAHLREQFDLLTEELIGIILFTGPMYVVYNSILSQFPAELAKSFSPVNFSTTIHVIISAIQKLSLRTVVQKTLFRGTSGRGFLPDCFWESQEGLNVYGFTEFGVMSMTSSKKVALEYSGVLSDRPHPTVLAFAPGAVDRGANVQPLSQFPFEVEFTFPPLSYIQPEFANGEHKIEYIQHPDKPSVQVPVIYVRVNANIRSPTLDELNSARKQNHVAAFRSQNRDTAAEIRKLCRERREELFHRLSSKPISPQMISELLSVQHTTISIDPLTTAFEGLQSVICRQCEDILSLHKERPESSFLDKFEHSRLVTEMVSVRKWALAKVLWYIEDTAQELDNIYNYPLMKSYREYISFCRSKIQKEHNDGLKRIQAMSLCRLIDLVGSADSQSDSASIVDAVENGTSTHDVELMLDAGFHVDSVNAAGNSLLSIAVRYGYLQLAQLLIQRGANVNFVNTKDGSQRTPVIFAASNDHSSCLKLLLESGAAPSSNALRIAQQHERSDCVDILKREGANASLHQETSLKLSMLSHQYLLANAAVQPLQLQAHFTAMAPLLLRPPPDDDLHVRRASKDVLTPPQVIAQPLQQVASTFPNLPASPTAASHEPLGVVIESCGFSWVRGPEIGRGAMGKVFMGLQEKEGILMAVKQVQAAGMENAAEEIKALETEIVMFSRLRHPRVVKYFGTERLPDGNIRIFLEYLPGGSLQQMLQRFGPFKEALVRRVMSQVLEGIQYLHSENICHRDIKAANILCHDLTSVKLADFGASKLTTTKQGQGSDSAFKSLVGTPYMMAPEVIRQAGHDFKADIWSLGCCCYELLCGRPPWSQFKDRTSAMFHIANTNKPPEIPLNFSQDCRNFMSVCLQLDPSKRPNSEKLLAHPWFRSEFNFSEEEEIKTPRTANGHKTNLNERSSRVPASFAASSPAIARNVDSPQRVPNVAPVVQAPALPLVSPLHTSGASPTARSSSFSPVQTSGSPPTGTVGSGNGAGRGAATKKVVQVISSSDDD